MAPKHVSIFISNPGCFPRVPSERSLKAAIVNLGLDHEMDRDFLFPHFIQSSCINGGHEDPAWKNPLNQVLLPDPSALLQSVSQDLEVPVKRRDFWEMPSM